MEYTGEIAALAASAVWATASLMFARLGEDIGALVLNTLKCVIALILMLGTLYVLDGIIWPAGLSTGETVALAASGLVGLTIGDTAYFNALNRLGPRRTLLLSALTPPMTALLAIPVLSEPLTWQLGVGMLLTMGGVVWVIMERHPGVRPERVREKVDEEQLEGRLSRIEKVGIAFGITAALCQATGNVLTKLGGSEISALEISIVRLVFGIFGLALILGALGRMMQTTKPMKNLRTFGILFAATFLGTFMGIWLMNAGLRYTQTGIASTLSSTSPIFILPLAYFIEGEDLTARSILGACIAVVGVAVLFV
jgi:drug/metabolite transporter (DMT)-like permease